MAEAAVNPYAEVDLIIDGWAKAAGSTLFKQWGETPSRYFHLPGNPAHECFQTVIFPPSGAGIVV